ncbi:uncharacterized protein CCOS01_09047 [Colletotrichum costaricense]|uniref:SGNH hydrolase-type esterase domain-containing protein n=1 Tax=Colletotrichum costaricense TaxID=1209916 RepID=A0AAI9YTL4_9PEZI|nr:uncharacterized protein CCOS01_09047 [Colletotrichum costaricense]KAK1523960.1 hypothetical protein CCOS01_09047 [Colletotrichum costaricense]
MMVAHPARIALCGYSLATAVTAAALHPTPLEHRDLTVAEAENHFHDALATSEYDMSLFDGNITDLSTRLVGWNGCDEKEIPMIYSGWQQSWKIMNLLYSEASTMNFNEAAAVEYLGPPSLDARDLSDVIKNGNDKSLGPLWCVIARTWIHELLHIDWVSKANQYGSNTHVTDLKMWVPKEGESPPAYQLLQIYSPKMAKTLARYKYDTGHWIAQSCENLTLYAMARYVQKALGNVYPHLPLAPEPPSSPPTEGVEPAFTVGDLFTMHSDGTVTIINSTAVGDLTWDPQCPSGEEIEAGADAEELFLGADVVTEADLPQEYLKKYRTWTGTEIGDKLTFKGVAPGQAVKPGTKLRILGVGDSITVGFLSERDGGDGNGYRLKLQQDLSKDEVVFVGTESAGGTMSGGYFAAWSGQTIQYISEHVSSSLEQRPNIILVHAGTNDMNPNLNIAKQGNDPSRAASRLGKLIDQIVDACPDAVVLVAMIISTCEEAQQVNTAQYQALIPGIVQSRRAIGKHVLAIDFTTFPTGSLRDCIHPTNQGYRDFGDYWYDFISQIPSDWIRQPVGDDPDRPTLPGIDANGGLDGAIPSPSWGINPIQVSSRSSVRTAALLGGSGGERTCKGGPVWRATGMIASGFGKAGGWQYRKNWIEAGKVADGLKLDSKFVRLHDMNGDGKADYIWLNPENGEIRCWINNLPAPWSPAGTNNSIIGSDAGVAESVFLADMNGDGLEDYMIVNPQNGAVKIWWNYGADESWVNGWKFIDGGQIASGVPHANWATLRFPDINGDGRADYVYIGAGGSLSHWMNTGTAGGQDVVFYFQGGIATGGTSDISNLVFADVDGDGRDDYLIWDAGRSHRLFEPANEKRRNPKNIRLADMDGDGKDDYAYIDDNGAIWLWYNQGDADTSMVIDGIRFADIDGDGIEDYVWLHLDTGAPTVFDGKDDYLVLDPKTGELHAYLNKGPDESKAEKWLWDPVGSIATGLGPGANVRFADIDGDGYDDYIFLKSNGGITIYRNVWETNKPPSSWRPLPEADASGIGQRPEEIDFVDVNGDGKADYVWTRARDGAARVWLNNYPNQPTWLEQPEIAGGVGVSGSDVRYAILQNTGRASYVAVDRTNGAIAAWLNSCTQLGDHPRPNVVFIGLRETFTESVLARSWIIYESATGSTIDICDDEPKGAFAAATTSSNPKFPTNLGEFDVHGVEGCVYSGSQDEPGKMQCPGVSGIRCRQDSQYDEVFHCGFCLIAVHQKPSKHDSSVTTGPNSDAPILQAAT